MATISRTKLKNRIQRKSNPLLVETIKAAMDQKAWNSLAKKLSGPTRKHSSVNLSTIDRATKEGDIVIITGKVLSSGTVSKKIRICTLSISASAREKLKSSKSEIVSILDEIKKNPKAEGVTIL